MGGEFTYPKMVPLVLIHGGLSLGCPNQMQPKPYTPFVPFQVAGKKCGARQGHVVSCEDQPPRAT